MDFSALKKLLGGAPESSSERSESDLSKDPGQAEEKRKELLDEARKREEAYAKKRREEAKRRREQQKRQWDDYTTESELSGQIPEEDEEEVAAMEAARRRKAEKLRSRREQMDDGAAAGNKGAGRYEKGGHDASGAGGEATHTETATAAATDDEPAQVSGEPDAEPSPSAFDADAFDAENASEDEKTRHYARILGLSGRIAARDIKRQYRQLMAQYHPDKVGHLGEKLQNVAEKESKQIVEAYEYFRQRFNF